MIYVQEQSVAKPMLVTSLSHPHFKKFPFLVDKLVDKRISSSHWHNYMQIWYTVSGEYSHTINGVRKRQPAGSVALVFPFSVHSIDSSHSDLSETRVFSISVYDVKLLEKSASYSTLSFSSASFDKHLLAPFITLSGRDKELCDELFEQMDKEYSKKLDMNSKKLTDKILSVLDLCAKSLNTSIMPNQVNKMRDRFEIINDAATAFHSKALPDTSLDSMCKYVFMSKRQFTDKFKETTGQTFGSYSKLFRLDNAIQLLRYSQKSLTEIAEECGFTTRSYFINECRAAFGVSPLIYKKQMIESDHVWGEHLHNLNMQKFAWRNNLSESDKYEWKMFALGKV